MKFWKKISLVALLAVSFVLPTIPAKTASAATTLLGEKTGYTKASDVVYKTSGSYVANWGAREEDCTFLSKYAEAFYTGSNVYETLSQKKGGTGKSDAPSSALYSALKSLMTSKHTHQTSYGETRQQYRYTDCVRNNTNNISSFYSGTQLSGTWDSGSTWNREHTWPNSKGLGGNDENDIMMLRPTWVEENSSRGNTAYGKSSSYYDPNSEGKGKVNLRGDCARIVLYVYTRWGNTGKMWGTSGVMESMNVLLDWMEEDPVDTWEMGRNDAVQSITGTRNVFVDYPEYAWLLFGQEIPSGMVTPSSGKSGTVTPPADSSEKEDSSVEDTKPDSSVEEETTESSDSCQHEYGRWYTTKAPTETEEGVKERFCQKCGKLDKQSIPPLGEIRDEIVTDPIGGSSSTEDVALIVGCTGSIGTSIGGVMLALAVCAVVRKKRK